MRADKSALGFLGYEFRYVKDRRYGTGGNYLQEMGLHRLQRRRK
jgi:hypothetical protein